MKKILKTYKFRLFPNKTQEILLNKTFGCTRFIYNQMLAERKLIYSELKEEKDKLYKYKYKTENKTMKKSELRQLIESSYREILNEVSFTKKHYIAILKILKKSKNKDEIVESIAELFTSDNPNFNRDLFIRACK
jgi:transposase